MLRLTRAWVGMARERANDARETKRGTDGRNRPGLRCRAPGTGRTTGAALALWCSGHASRDEGCFPSSTCGRGRGRSCRSARPTTCPGPRRRQGGGAGAARSCAGQRPGPCIARGAGLGRMGVGNERHAFAIAKDLAPATSCEFPRGKKPLATLENLYLQTCIEGRSVLVSLLFRVFAFDRRATSWSPACRGAARVASPVFAASLSIFGATSAHLVVEFESPPQDPVRGLPG